MMQKSKRGQHMCFLGRNQPPGKIRIIIKKKGNKKKTTLLARHRSCMWYQDHPSSHAAREDGSQRLRFPLPRSCMVAHSSTASLRVVAQAKVKVLQVTRDQPRHTVITGLQNGMRVRGPAPLQATKPRVRQGCQEIMVSIALNATTQRENLAPSWTAVDGESAMWSDGDSSDGQDSQGRKDSSDHGELRAIRAGAWIMVEETRAALSMLSMLWALSKLSMM